MIKIAQSKLLGLEMFHKLGATENQMFARIHELADEVAAEHGVTKQAAIRAVAGALIKQAKVDANVEALAARTAPPQQRSAPAAAAPKPNARQMQMAAAQSRLPAGNRGTASQRPAVAQQIRHIEGK